ncbi:MAG: hypothetical protein ACODAE_02005 [Gemmatimonadota bacterium]
MTRRDPRLERAGDERVGRFLRTAAAGLAAALALATATLAPAPRPLTAQTGPGLDAAGVAGAYMGLARGHQALHWNPANLSLDGDRRWSIGLPAIMATGALIGPPFSEMPVLLDDDLTDDDRADFLAQMPDPGLGFRADLDVPIAGIGVGGFAVALSSTALVDVGVGRELIDLYLFTRQYGDIDYSRITDYRIGDTYFSDARYSTLIAGYARSVPLTFGMLHVGAAGRLVQGHELQRGRVFEPIIDILNEEFALPALAARSTGGTGLGLDLGAALQPLPGLTLGLAVQNLLHTMRWDERIEVRGDEFSGADLADTGPTDVYDRLRTRSFDPDAATLEEHTVVSSLFDDAHFPRVLRLGATLQVGATALNGTLATTAGDGVLHVGWPRYIALGVEQDLPIIPVLTFRAGVANSLFGASALNGGLSLNFGPVHINAAVGRLTGEDPDSDANILENATIDYGFGDDGDDDTRGYRFGDRLADASGYTFGLGVQIGGP